MSRDLDRIAAALADRYTFERELDEDGMATVYLARDLKHDRGVALEVMRPELANELGVDRFVRESRLAPVAAAIGKTDEAFDRFDRASTTRTVSTR